MKRKVTTRKGDAGASILPKILSMLYLVFIYTFALAPLAIVVISSFNSAPRFPAPFESFSLKWYIELLQHSRFLRSGWVSIRVAISAAFLATILGIPVSLFMVRAEFRGKSYINAFIMLPLMIPQIALGIALLQMFSLIGLGLNIISLIIAHVLLVMPYVVRATVASLQMLDPNIEDAALVLGANRFTTFRRITLPLIRGGVSAGFVLALIMSFVNVALSFFISSPRTNPLPVTIFAYLDQNLNPLIAAVASLTVFVAIVVSLFLERVMKVRLIL
jgi:putative spermidine/putrescine transport system permease protein